MEKFKHITESYLIRKKNKRKNKGNKREKERKSAK